MGGSETKGNNEMDVVVDNDGLSEWAPFARILPTVAH